MALRDDIERRYSGELTGYRRLLDIAHARWNENESMVRTLPALRLLLAETKRLRQLVGRRRTPRPRSSGSRGTASI
jgi:hypothetical protein